MRVRYPLWRTDAIRLNDHHERIVAGTTPRRPFVQRIVSPAGRHLQRMSQVAVFRTVRTMSPASAGSFIPPAPPRP